jgi:hypothetical protein
MKKTPEYLRKAIKNYQSKFDLQQLRLPKGTRSRAAAVGLSPADMASLIVEEIEKREARQGSRN